MKRIPSLDGLRAISILLVLLGHLSGTKNFFPESFLFADAADFGVRVFFVISGYLITSLLLKERLETGRINLKQFYWRRAFRILPAAYVYVLVIVAFSWRDITGREVTASCLYLANFIHVRWTLAHLWSLSVEEQFYFLWPAVLVLFFRYSKRVAVGAIILAPVLRVVFYLHGWKEVNHYFPTVADSVATGCLLAMIAPGLSRFGYAFRSRWFLVVPLVTFAMLLVDNWNHRVYSVVGLTIMHAGVAICLFRAIQIRDGILNFRPLIWLGRASYSIYLWQMPFCNRYSHDWWATFPINIFLAMGFGCLSLYLIEQPMLRLRKRSCSDLKRIPEREDDRWAPAL